MPRTVQLLPHNPDWPRRAAEESTRLTAALGDLLLTIHHIGSTSIPTICAKPTIDLLPVVSSLEKLDALQSRLLALGYEYRGEFGIPTRRYCPLTDPLTGQRTFHVHFFPAHSPHITRHLAFRDYLLAHPQQARAYESIKLLAAAQHPTDLSAYCDFKDPWIQSCQLRAAAWYQP